MINREFNIYIDMAIEARSARGASDQEISG